MTRVLQLLLGAPALAFIVVGVGWWVAPATVAAQVGMTLETGLGLSTQIGDLGSFFVVMGCCILTGLARGQRVWLLAALMLVGVAALGRIIAWLFHDAAFAGEALVVELPVTALLAFAARRGATT